MSYSIVDRNGMLTGELREFAERRLLFALARFDSRIRRVTLVVSDENGPRGGVDKACRLTVQLLNAEDVVIQDQDQELAACLARVAERAGRAVARAIDKTQRIDRQRPQVSW